MQTLPRDALLLVLSRAIDRLDPNDLAEIVEDYLAVPRRPASARGAGADLLARVRAFHAAACRREYYEDFLVDSRNFRMKSTGTSNFIASILELLEACVQAREAGEPATDVAGAFDLLFDLVRRIDKGGEIVFFADEGGSWQIGIAFLKVVPVWFACLAETSDAERYADVVVSSLSAIDMPDEDRRKLLFAALTCASDEQQREIEVVVEGVRCASRDGSTGSAKQT